MSSWRETASRTAQHDLDALLDAVLTFARERLDETGSFYPFSATVDARGGLALAASAPAANRRADPTEVFAQLIADHRERADELRAVALVSDVTLGGRDGDAVRADLEHREGPVMTVLLPYRASATASARPGGYGALRALEGERQIWT